MANQILVTGAKGFAGGHLMTRLRQDFPEASLHASTFDVTDSEAVTQGVHDLRPDTCVHLAAIAAVAEATREPDRAWNVNLHGTLNVARAVRAHAPDCLLLYVSSAEIYGGTFRSGLPLNEDAVPAPLNTYAATKAAADLALSALAVEGLRCVRLRPFNHTGPGQSEAFVVAAFARQIALIAAGRQPPVLRVGSLHPERDFLDVRDVCAAYSACVQRVDSIEPGTILNIASGTPRKIGDVLRDLLDAAGLDAKIEQEPARLRANDIPLACADSSRARAVLRWQPVIPWQQTISDVLDDWRMRIDAR